MISARWLLRSVRVCDLLAYQGEQRFDFTPGLQVVEAPNHTGKTSLAMAVLWGLSGKIPKLSRLDLKSFRLSNKHAGADARCRVEIELADGNGRTMLVRRGYGGRRRADETLEVVLGDEELEGETAGERILEELGLGVASLQGCGVVLQDQRLKLITGTDSQVSEVVNDMLGLESLSEVVPALEDMAAEAQALCRRIEACLQGGSPLQRWEDDERRLAEALHELENQALAGGYAAERLQEPRALLRAELAGLATDLEVEPADPGSPARSQIDRLRRRLAAARKSGPQAQPLAEAGARRVEREQQVREARTLADAWRAHDEALTAVATGGEMDLALLSRAAVELDQALEENRLRSEAARGEKQLLEVAYRHLLGHPGDDRCPVCLSAAPGAELLRSVRERMDLRAAETLDRLEADRRELTQRRERTANRQEELRELARAHDGLLRRSAELAASLDCSGVEARWAMDRESLFGRAEARAALLGALETAAEAAERQVEALREREQELRAGLAEREETLLQPLERRINAARDLLVPLVDACDGLEAHGALREDAAQRTDELGRLEREARELSGRLKKIAAAVSEEECARAREAIEARLPFVSGFFARVAGNPDFTGLEIRTTVLRNQVAYSLRATSSRMAALADMVGHVLSEGDMSAAGMALLLGLASGESHRLGFLLLDDPAQGMDPVLQRNFARELARLEEKPQIIILTHQPEFSECLEACGAERRSLGRWQEGRLVHA